jgi:hypothetical protein
MRTKQRQLIGIALVIAVFIPSMTVCAQVKSATPLPGDWSAVTSVPEGDRLVVKLKGGQTIEGKLSSVSDTTLSLSAKSKSVDLKRDEIFSVHHVIKKSATKATLIGMGIGAGAGAAIGLAGSGGNNSFDKIDHAVTAGLTVLGAGAGAAVGYFIGRSGRKRVLIYQAP